MQLNYRLELLTGETIDILQNEKHFQRDFEPKGSSGSQVIEKHEFFKNRFQNSLSRECMLHLPPSYGYPS